MTIVAVEVYGVDRLLEELRDELQGGRYRPEAVRRVFIPKSDGRQRPLWIPRVRDRIVQAAVKLVIEPLFEASFRSGSYGFRPKRGARQAVEAIRQAVNRGRIEVIDLDLESYFDTIDQNLLVRLVRRRVSDPRVLRLIRGWLRAGVMQEGERKETLVGTPQGGVISPLLANIYLHPLDVHWERAMKASTMVRYADDLVVLCPKGGSEKAMPELRHFLGRLKLRVNERKTRLGTCDEGFDFLGVHFRRKASRRNPRRQICYCWPSRRSMQRLRDKARALLGVDGRASLAEKIEQLNPAVRGWGNYFRHYNSGEHFVKVDLFIWHRLLRWLRRKHDGRWRTSNAYEFFKRAGWYTLAGTVRYAR